MIRSQGDGGKNWHFWEIRINAEEINKKVSMKHVRR